MSCRSKSSSVRRSDRSVTILKSDEVDEGDDAVDGLIKNFARTNRKITLPSADDILVLANVQKMNLHNIPVSRGAVVDEFTREDRQDSLPTSTIFGSIAYCARLGLIESHVIENQTNRISGRPVQAVRPSVHGQRFLNKLAEVIDILDAAMTSNRSNKALN